MGQLFNETGTLISEQTEITGVNTINFGELPWISTSLLCSKVYQITNATMTGSFSCQCTTTLHEEKKETQKYVNTIHRQSRILLENSLVVIGLSWGPGPEEKWYGTFTDKPDGSWNQSA